MNLKELLFRKHDDKECADSLRKRIKEKIK